MEAACRRLFRLVVHARLPGLWRLASYLAHGRQAHMVSARPPSSAAMQFWQLYIARSLAGDAKSGCWSADGRCQGAGFINYPARPSRGSHAIDINGECGGAPRIAPDVVIHTSGPFQTQDHRVARPASRRAGHYVDLADRGISLQRSTASMPRRRATCWS